MKHVLRMTLFSIVYFSASSMIGLIIQIPLLWYVGWEKWEAISGGSCGDYVANYYYSWNIFVVFDYSFSIVSMILAAFIYFKYLEILISFRHRILFGLIYAGIYFVMLELLMGIFSQPGEFDCFPLWIDILDFLIIMASPIIVGAFYDRFVIKGEMNGQKHDEII